MNEVSSYGGAGSSHCEAGQHGQEILRYDPTGQGVGEVTAYAGVVSPPGDCPGLHRGLLRAFLSHNRWP